MSDAAATVIAGVIGAYTALAIWLRRRDRKRPSERDQLIAAAHDHYEGPDSLRLLQDLEAHMKAYGEAVADLYDTTPGGPQ